MSGIMRGGFPVSEAHWSRETLELAFRTVPGAGEFPALTSTRQRVWTPPGPVLVRAVAGFTLQGDAITAAGGATAVKCGLNESLANVDNMFFNIGFAYLQNGDIAGHGRGGSIGNGTTSGFPNSQADGGVTLSPIGAYDGINPAGSLRDGIYMSVDGGSATGVIVLSFEFRQFKL